MKKLLSLFICGLIVFGAVATENIKAEENAQDAGSSEIIDNNTWWNKIAPTSEAELLDIIAGLPNTEVGTIGFSEYGYNTFLSNAVLKAMQDKGIDIYTVIGKNTDSVLKHYQTMNIKNTELNNFTPYFETIINGSNINKQYGLTRSVGVECEYKGTLPGRSVINVAFDANLFNVVPDRDNAINVYQLNENGDVVKEFKGNAHYMSNSNRLALTFATEEGAAYVISDEQLNASSNEVENTTPENNETPKDNDTQVKKGVNTSDSTNMFGLFALMMFSGAVIFKVKNAKA